jgi:hypothetical protein
MKIGDIVYLKTDPSQSPRMVTAILTRQGGRSYYLSRGTEETHHYEIEMSTEADIMLKTTG